MTPRRARWPRDAFAEAVYRSVELSPPQRLVALVYADHARDGDTAWVTYERLSQRTGLGRSTAARALAALVAVGWLKLVEPPVSTALLTTACWLSSPRAGLLGIPERDVWTVQ